MKANVVSVPNSAPEHRRRRRPGEGAVPRRVGRKRRRGQQRFPLGVRRRVGVAIAVGVVNGGDRTPRGETALRAIPAEDGGVGQGDVQEGEQPSILRRRFALRAGPRLGDHVPVALARGRAGAVVPEPGDQRLVRGASEALAPPETFDIVEVGGVFLAGQRRRRGWRKGGGGAGTRATDLGAAAAAAGRTRAVSAATHADGRLALCAMRRGAIGATPRQHLSATYCPSFMPRPWRKSS